MLGHESRTQTTRDGSATATQPQMGCNPAKFSCLCFLKLWLSNGTQMHITHVDVALSQRGLKLFPMKTHWASEERTETRTLSHPFGSLCFVGDAPFWWVFQRNPHEGERTAPPSLPGGLRSSARCWAQHQNASATVSGGPSVAIDVRGDRCASSGSKSWLWKGRAWFWPTPLLARISHLV